MGKFLPPQQRIDRVVVGEADRENANRIAVTAATQAAGVSQLETLDGTGARYR